MERTIHRITGIFIFLISIPILYFAITIERGLAYTLVLFFIFVVFVFVGFSYIFLDKIKTFLKKRKRLHNVINWIVLIFGIIAIGLLIWRIIAITFFE